MDTENKKNRVIAGCEGRSLQRENKHHGKQDCIFFHGMAELGYPFILFATKLMLRAQGKPKTATKKPTLPPDRVEECLYEQLSFGWGSDV